MLVFTSGLIGRKEEGSLIDDENRPIFKFEAIYAAANRISRIMNDEVRNSLVIVAKIHVEKNCIEEHSIRAWNDRLRSALALSAKEGETKGFQPVLDSGLLVGIFGPKVSESIRKLIGEKSQNVSAGSEWPHIHHKNSLSFDDLMVEIRGRC